MKVWMRLRCAVASGVGAAMPTTASKTPEIACSAGAGAAPVPWEERSLAVRGAISTRMPDAEALDSVWWVSRSMLPRSSTWAAKSKKLTASTSACTAVLVAAACRERAGGRVSGVPRLQATASGAPSSGSSAFSFALPLRPCKAGTAPCMDGCGKVKARRSTAEAVGSSYENSDVVSLSSAPPPGGLVRGSPAAPLPSGMDTAESASVGPELFVCSGVGGRGDERLECLAGGGGACAGREGLWLAAMPVSPCSHLRGPARLCHSSATRRTA